MDWSYIAGFFDGEGCVSIGKNKRPVCTIAQTNGDHRVIEKIQEFLRSNAIPTSVVDYVKRSPKHKPSKTLLITSSFAVEDFLSRCLPYLIVKRPKSEIALQQLRQPNLVRKARESSTEQAAREYALGELNRTEAASKYGVGYRRLSRKMKELGIPLRKRWENGTWRSKSGKFAITKSHVKIIRSMPFEILTHGDVAELLNCHRSTIDKILTEPYWKNV